MRLGDSGFSQLTTAKGGLQFNCTKHCSVRQNNSPPMERIMFLRNRLFAMTSLGLIAGLSCWAAPGLAAGVAVPSSARTHAMPWGEFKLAPRIVKKLAAGEKA